MNITPTAIPDVLLSEPRIFGDARGFFLESFNLRQFAGAAGITPEFVQDNHSRSGKGVLRGLHYQIKNPQGKLIRVIGGEVFDVAVDMRRSSPTFKKWTGARLSDQNKHVLWIPPGFAHGFLVLSDKVDFLYKTTAYYDAASERSLRFDDPTIGVQWPFDELGGTPLILSEKDKNAPPLAQAETFA